MPPLQYRLVHSEARLSDAERQQLELGIVDELDEGSARQVAGALIGRPRASAHGSARERPVRLRAA